MFPVMLSVRGRSCLVVGGGGIALRKVESLLVEGARVTVVAASASGPIEELAARGRITLERRAYRAGEARNYALVFAATDDRDVNRQVFLDGDGASVWVNVADDPDLCSFHLPARVQRGSLQVAVASSGRAPFATRRLRQLLERRLGAEWSEWIDAASRYREMVRQEGATGVEQEELFDRFFDATIDPERLAARVPRAEEVASWLAAQGHSSDRAAAPERPSGPCPSAGAAGLVSLVGAGPGDPGLLTLRGRARLLAADAVVLDRLAAPALPCDLKPDVELHAVGKEAGNHPVPQEEINALLVRLGREGKRVVRLKGGDPYVFGRGGEEAEALRQAGVAFEVVPGVTSGVAVPALAGIPVTHRREAVRVTLLTAHETTKDNGSQVRWDLLAADPCATLVGYMGVTSLPSVVGRLLEGGMDPATPAAVIRQGTTSAQRSVHAPLADIAGAVARCGLQPPALFVIGPTARHAPNLDWLATCALRGQRIVVVAPAERLAEGLELAGAEVVAVTLPVRGPARVVLGALPLTACVLKSATEVDALDGERDRPGWSREVVACCIGPETAGRARERGWPRVEELRAGATCDDIVSAIAGGRARATQT
jgi:uroporphyrin-III C-methyltransferase/precorrin-2 dehydrogenase/sirohydrochlorin ferrochelatase